MPLFASNQQWCIQTICMTYMMKSALDEQSKCIMIHTMQIFEHQNKSGINHFYIFRIDLYTNKSVITLTVFQKLNKF